MSKNKPNLENKKTKKGRLDTPKGPSIFAVLVPYKKLIYTLIFLALAANALSLALPKVISRGIDAFVHGTFSYKSTITEFVAPALGILINSNFS